jgi:hypothetical protein
MALPLTLQNQNNAMAQSHLTAIMSTLALAGVILDLQPALLRKFRKDPVYLIQIMQLLGHGSRLSPPDRSTAMLRYKQTQLKVPGSASPINRPA